LVILGFVGDGEGLADAEDLPLTLDLLEAEGRHQVMQISQYLGGKTKPLPSELGISPMLT
jgi:hypothetical protein